MYSNMVYNTKLHGLALMGSFYRRSKMKKNYLTPSINVVSYNVVDIVTTSVTVNYAHVKESWIEGDWLAQ